MNENICKAGQCADLLLQDLVAANSRADAITRILLGDLIEQAIAIRTRLAQIDKALVAEGRDGE